MNNVKLITLDQRRKLSQAISKFELGLAGASLVDGVPFIGIETPAATFNGFKLAEAVMNAMKSDKVILNGLTFVRGDIEQIKNYVSSKPKKGRLFPFG